MGALCTIDHQGALWSTAFNCPPGGAMERSGLLSTMGRYGALSTIDHQGALWSTVSY